MRGQPYQIFGEGVPTAPAPDGSTYYDTASAYAQYVYANGAWQPQGGGGGSPYIVAPYNYGLGIVAPDALVPSYGAYLYLVADVAALYRSAVYITVINSYRAASFVYDQNTAANSRIEFDVTNLNNQLFLKGLPTLGGGAAGTVWVDTMNANVLKLN